MNWYKKSQRVKYIKFYHATIPYFAEEIIDSGIIKRSSQLSSGHQGWNFYEETLGHTYGDAVFLSKNDEKSLAINYADKRLNKLWDEQDLDKIATDEDLRYIALFTVYIKSDSKNLIVAKDDPGEYHYFGNITNNKNDDAYWIGPEWISREKEADQFVEKKEKNEFIHPIEVDSKSTPKGKIVPPFSRSMPYSSNLNWYKLAILEYQLHKEAGIKEGILAALLSILSSISIPYEAKAIRSILDNVSLVQQQKIVNTVNQLTDQNKNVDELNIDDIKVAIENIKKDLKENMSDQDIPAGELNIEELKDTIRRHEGKSNKVYLDPSKKNWCVGHGFNLNKPNSKNIIGSVGADYNAVLSGKQSLSDDQVEKILDISVKEAIEIAKDFTSNYNQLPSKAKLVLANMAFMGRGTLGKFNDLRNALAKNDYNRAADEMLDSLWAKQVGRRATELAEIMRSLG